jgi:hypothetical protein
MSKFYPVVQKIRMIGIVMILMMLCVGSVAASGLVTSPMSTPENLAQSLVGSGVTISNVEFTGDGAYCSGTFTGGSGIIGFEDGVILSSGDIANVIGPNVEDGISWNNGELGDTDLDGLIPGYSTFDACVLEFDFVPQANSLQFDYVFTSDEYNEYVNDNFNDVFGFFVNGGNVALIPGTILPVAINNVNNGNPYNTDPRSYPGFYINNDLNDGGPFLDTEMDGLTTVFTATASVNQGVTNHIKLAIADAGDAALDSNVFIKGSSFVSTNLLLTPTDATNPVGATHTVTATYTPPTGAALAGNHVIFTITAGPNAGMTGSGYTDSNGVATWSYSSTLAGTDTIIASLYDDIEQMPIMDSNLAYKTWVTDNVPVPEFPTLAIPFGAMGVLLVVALYLRKQ